jgi:hypothetical protein
MVEMQQSSVPPATPAPPALPGQAVAGGSAAPIGTVDLSKFTLPQLRRMHSELSQQRSDFASRRSNTGDIYERSSGDNREGIAKRLQVLDDNIMAYENEMARVGREIAARGGGITTENPGQQQDFSGYMREDDAAGMAFGFSFMTLILAVFFTRRFMRKKYAGLPASRQQPNLIASNERLERIEQAVDTIAVEMERVSENQRFMTRLMTETQLGDTIKDVRKSTELAKSAAESSG